MFLGHLLPLVGKIFFRCFVIYCFFCIALPFVNISLIFLLSIVLSSLLPQVVWLFFLVLSFAFCSDMFQRLSFVLLFWPVFVDFLFAFPGEFLILVLIFSSCFLRRSQFSHKLNSLLHSLVHLIQLYYSLIHKVVLDLFYSFSRFSFCSCDSVCSELFGCALFGYVAFLFSKLGSSFRLGCFCLLILDVSGTILLSCLLFIFWCIYSISVSEN